MGAGFLRLLVVVGFLFYVFVGVAYSTMGPQAFFQALVHVAAVFSAAIMVGILLWVLRNRERIRRSVELRMRSRLVLDPPEARYMWLTTWEFEERYAAMLDMLRKARSYFMAGDERAALFTLFNAVASMLRLVCEAEGYPAESWACVRRSGSLNAAAG